MWPITEFENQTEWKIANVERGIFTYLNWYVMLSLLKWIANLWLINNMIYPNTVFERWQRQVIHSYQHGIYFSRDLHSISSWKGRKIIKMLVGYLVGWSCKNDEIMQKGVARIWPFMKLGESVTFISIQYVKLHILSWIFLSFTLKIFTPRVFSKNKWVPQICWWE